MNSGKISHSLYGLAVTWASAWLAWSYAHVSMVIAIIVGAFSIRASYWTARAAKQTILRKQRDKEI